MAADSQTSASGNDHARMLRDSVADFVKRGTDIKRVRRLRDTQPMDLESHNIKAGPRKHLNHAPRPLVWEFEIVWLDQD